MPELRACGAAAESYPVISRSLACDVNERKGEVTTELSAVSQYLHGFTVHTFRDACV